MNPPVAKILEGYIDGRNMSFTISHSPDNLDALLFGAIQRSIQHATETYDRLLKNANTIIKDRKYGPKLVEEIGCMEYRRGLFVTSLRRELCKNIRPITTGHSQITSFLDHMTHTATWRDIGSPSQIYTHSWDKIFVLNHEQGTTWEMSFPKAIDMCSGEFKVMGGDMDKLTSNTVDIESDLRDLKFLTALTEKATVVINTSETRLKTLEKDAEQSARYL